MCLLGLQRFLKENQYAKSGIYVWLTNLKGSQMCQLISPLLEVTCSQFIDEGEKYLKHVMTYLRRGEGGEG